ncbi:MAG: sulfatase-like hydrolase/transferase, partial [Polyangiaceae bacterium]|nr:sulfatase-like hydrolase/transferase [Polyangiaceae bacterium]
MPWNGYSREIAPYLTALSKKSISYSHMYALSSYTAMSVGGLLSGRYPSELQRDGYFFSRHAKGNLLFPEVLQQKGVQTLAVHAHGYFDPGRSGLE